jgi:hypothetical protein
MWKHCIIQAKPSVKMTPEQQESARRWFTQVNDSI